MMSITPRTEVLGVKFMVLGGDPSEYISIRQVLSIGGGGG
jgi:hypothetical protein